MRICPVEFLLNLPSRFICRVSHGLATGPRLLRRCEAIADRALERLRVRHRSARPLAAGEALPGDAPRLLLQLLLLSPERLLVSLSPCEQGRGLGTWPNWHAPAGLASVDVPKSTHARP